MPKAMNFAPWWVSGGKPAVTTRGMKEGEMKQIAAWIDRALTNREDEAALAQIRKEVSEMNQRFPLP